MPILSESDILEQAAERIREDLEIKRTYWRSWEVDENYAVLEGIQWTEEDHSRQINDEMPAITINKTSPVIDAISGFEVQNRSEASYSPRLRNEEAHGFSDIAEVGVTYLKQQSQADFANSQAFKDMLVCGVGAVDMSIDYERNINGEAKLTRIFPGFLLWDAASREKNLKDANWCAVASVVDARTLAEEDGEDFTSATGVNPSFSDNDFLNYYDTTLRARNLAIIYTYQWRIKEPVIRVSNPFTDAMQDPEIAPMLENYIPSAIDRFKINPADSMFIFQDMKLWREFEKELKALGLLYKKVKQKVWRYYRCQIRNGKVKDAAENFTQNGFGTNFMTGKYSEHQQCWYGMLRSMKPAQRLLNEAVSNYQGYLRTIPMGGVHIESDAVTDIKAFIDTYAKAKKVTVYNPGALSGGKMMPKAAPQLPPALPEMIGMSGAALMETAGVTPQFMGMMESKMETAKLQGQIVRQTLTTLAEYFDAKKFFTIDQGRGFIDILKVLAENNPGRLIKNITGKGSEQYVPLLLDGMAAEYDISVEDSPKTPGERQELFEKLLELAMGVLGQQGGNIMPLVMKYAPLPKEETDAILQAMQPPPAPEPNPMDVLTAEANIALLQGQAKKAESESIKNNAESLNYQRELDIREQENQTKKDQAMLKMLEAEKALQDNAIKLDNEYKLKQEKLRIEQEERMGELRLKGQVAAAELAIKAETARFNAETPNAPEVPKEAQQMDMTPIVDAIREVGQALTSRPPSEINFSRDANGNLQKATVQ